MLKWILGILGVLALLLAGTCWYGYRELTSGGDTARVAIVAAPERVWQHLVDLDSLRAWQDSAATVTSTGGAVLAVGDTVRIETSLRGRPVGAEQRMHWVVARVDSPRVVVWTAIDDSTGIEVVRRIDSIAVAGDSVILTSRFGSPMIDSLRTADSGGGLARSLMGGVTKMASAALRAIAEQDLARLKARLERP